VSPIRTRADGETDLSFGAKVRALRILSAGSEASEPGARNAQSSARGLKSEPLTQDLIQTGVLLTAVNTEPRGSHRELKTSSSFCSPWTPFSPTSA
jgi:hypothetical protein